MPGWFPLIFLLTPVGISLGLFFKRDLLAKTWKLLAVQGAIMLAVGCYLGLFVAPPERDMGDVARIFVVHVPQVQMALLAVTLNFVCSFLYLLKKSWVSDALAEASADVGLYFGVVGVALGAIWAKPTWGIWWNWDPRLTSAAVMLVYYFAYLAYRRFTDNPDSRATVSAALGTFGIVIPVTVYFSVVWMVSLHQKQSNPNVVYPELVFAYRFAAVGFFCLMVVFIWLRYVSIRASLNLEVAPPEAIGLPAKGAA